MTWKGKRVGMAGGLLNLGIDVRLHSVVESPTQCITCRCASAPSTMTKFLSSKVVYLDLANSFALYFLVIESVLYIHFLGNGSSVSFDPQSTANQQALHLLRFILGQALVP